MESELDIKVGSALGWRQYHWSSDDWDWRGPPTDDDEIGPLMAGNEWSPSTDWNCGGPIVEMANIAIAPFGDGTWEAISRSHYGHEGPEGDHVSIGETPLIAAMRAFVKSDGR